MDETAMFLQAARVGGEAHKRVCDRTMTVDVGDWLRLVEMAERAGPRRQAAPVPGEGDVRREARAMTYTGTVWRGKAGDPRFALVEAEPHAGWDGTPTVYARTRAVIDGVRQRVQPSIMTLDALLERFERVAREDWPGVL